MGKKTILLVEDNEDDIELTLIAFRRNNIDCDFAIVRDGAEAIEYLFNQNTGNTLPGENRPALILLDLNLPKINGLEVLKRIRASELTKNIPIIVLSTSRDKKDIVMSYNNGANSYIIKPVDFSEFVETVNYLGKYWLFLNELPYQSGVK